MGGDAGDMLKQVAGYGVGALSALTSIKSGGLQNYFLNRQRALEDPAIRASLVGSPFASGVLFQPGSDAPAAPPGTMPAAGTVAAPSDVAWIQQQDPTRRFLPHLTPLPAQTEEQVLAAQGIVSGLQSTDPLVRAQSKLAAKIPLTGAEQDTVIEMGKRRQAGLGPGGTVGVEVPGMPVTIGSPYSVSPVGYDEYATPGEALAVAQTRGTNWGIEQTNRGTWKPVQKTPPAAPPAAGTVTPAPAATTAPGTQAAPPSGRGVTPPGYGATKPPTAPTPSVPTPQRTPAPPPVQTGTPGLGAGYVQLPAPPPAPPPYAGGPYDPNAVASTPGPPPAAPPSPAPKVGFPSPAFDENAPPDTGAPAAAPQQPAVPVYPAQGFVFHHSGGTTLQGLRATLADRGLGSEYLMDRDGTVYNYAGAGSPHIQPNDRYGGIAPGLSNKNAVGMELVARNDADVTPAQVASARNFIATNYPNTPVYGHGEVNPGHKEASEGMAVVNAIRTARAGVAQPGFLTRALALAGPSSAEAAEVPGWGPPPATAQPAAPTALPDTSTPQFVPSPPQPQPAPPPPPPGVERAGAAIAPGLPPGTAPLPMTRKSYTSASGEQVTYELGPPSELAADAAKAGIADFRYASQQQIDYFNQLRQERINRAQRGEEDIRRTARPLTESEAKATDYLYAKRDALNQLYKDFPNPNDRAKYIGWPYRSVMDYVQFIHKDPQFGRFVDDLAPFQDLEQHSNMLREGGVNLEPGKVPTGYEPDPDRFEDRLADLNFDLNKQLYRQIALRQMSVGDLSAGAMNVVQSYFDRLQDERIAARQAADAAARAAATGAPTDTGPTITVAPPTTTTQPPTQAPGGFTVLGDQPMQ